MGSEKSTAEDVRLKRLRYLLGGEADEEQGAAAAPGHAEPEQPPASASLTLSSSTPSSPVASSTPTGPLPSTSGTVQTAVPSAHPPSLDNTSTATIVLVTGKNAEG